MTPNDVALLAKIATSIDIIRSHDARGNWSEDYGIANQFLTKILERDLREWIRSHPPGTSDYAKDEPRRAVYQYFDHLIPELSNDVVSSLLFSSAYFEKIAARTISSLQTASKTTEKTRVANRYPDYLPLLRQIRETKSQWNVEDAAIRQSPSFRMMGGLARLGSRAGTEYSRLVQKAQDMERSVLGKTLTKHTRPSR